jgi:hypothetical protein
LWPETLKKYVPFINNKNDKYATKTDKTLKILLLANLVQTGSKQLCHFSNSSRSTTCSTCY